MTGNLHVAQQWLARGQAVIPLSRTAKSPCVSGFSADTPDDTIASRFRTDQWWKHRPGSHVAVLCGRGPHPLVVLDLDTLKTDQEPLDERWDGCQHGSDVLERLCAEHGQPWPATYTVITPSGGLHLYYQAPAGTLGNRVRALPLVDSRDIGGYVVAAGSTGATGTYTVDTNEPQQPAPLPDWLADAFRPPKRPPTNAQRPPRTPAGRDRRERYMVAALDGAYRDITTANDGRKRLLFARTRRLAELGLDDAVVEQHMLAAALHAGLQERPSLATIRSGLRAGHTNGATQ